MDYVFLDNVRITPSVSAKSEKMLKDDEWFFPMHFPGNPMLPGVFQMEMIQQTGGLIINTMDGKRDLPLYFYAAKDISVRKSAKPGDVLCAEVNLLKYKRGIAKFHGFLSVNEEPSCEMDFSLVAPDELVGGLADA